MKSTAFLLTLLLATAPSLFGDDHGKKGEKRDHEGDQKNEERARVQRVTVVQPVVAVPVNRVIIINNDVNRLESLLATTQTTAVVIPQPTLIRVGNEANVLAIRISTNVRTALRSNPDALTAARMLKMHIREMRAAAARGDLAAAQLHAREALPFAIRLDGLV